MLPSVHLFDLGRLMAGIGPGADCPFYKWNQAMLTFARKNLKAVVANSSDVHLPTQHSQTFVTASSLLAVS